MYIRLSRASLDKNIPYSRIGEQPCLQLRNVKDWTWTWKQDPSLPVSIVPNRFKTTCSSHQNHSRLPINQSYKQFLRHSMGSYVQKRVAEPLQRPQAGQCISMQPLKVRDQCQVVEPWILRHRKVWMRDRLRRLSKWDQLWIPSALGAWWAVIKNSIERFSA